MQLKFGQTPLLLLLIVQSVLLFFLKKNFFFQTGCKAQWAAGTHKKKSRMLVLVFLIYLVFGALRLNSDHWVSCTDWVTKEGGKKTQNSID